MRDPIGAFDTIKENFLRYVKTAFKTKFESVEEDRESLLNTDKVLFREPWIEPLPEYLSSKKYIKDLKEEDLPGMSINQIEIFKGLVNGDGKTGLAPDYFLLHDHQANMLRQSLGDKHCIITSGTGSGKTEAFLLPLFAQLSKELANWASPREKSPHVDSWWKPESVLSDRELIDTGNGFSLSSAVQQRAHESRQAGMRAMILYPMNALVEDQMTRLRIALDSIPVRNWFDQNAPGNNIYFGRYNGATPIAGTLERIDDDGASSVNAHKINRLRRELNSIEGNSQRVEQYLAEKGINGQEAHELRSFFPRLDGAEMRCRFDMQSTPPDILITNFSMLSIMLMREVDNAIFEETRKWLACIDIEESEREKEKANRVFHLIIDEMHLYRGTQGTEVAYLLKLVLKRLGLFPGHAQLKILASSASLDSDDDKSLKYISDFFGFSGPSEILEKFEIIPGEDSPVDTLPENVDYLPVPPFISLARSYEACNGELSSHQFLQSCISAGEELRISEGIIDMQVHSIEDYARLLLHPNILLRERMFSACRVTAGAESKYRPVATFRKQSDGNPVNLPYYFEEIFGMKHTPEEIRMAAKGLLISRSLFDEPDFKGIPDQVGRKLPRFRFHYFFRNIEGMWASVHPIESNDHRTAGKLYPAPRIKSDKDHRVLELLYCDNCGTTFFGGSRSRSRNGVLELLPVDPNIEGIPEKTTAKLVERRTYQEYAVFWPEGNQRFTDHDPPPANYWRQVTLNDYRPVDFHASWVESSLHKYSGDVEFEHTKAELHPENWVKGRLFVIRREDSSVEVSSRDEPSNLDEHGNLLETHRALPCVCPSCGVNEQYRIKYTPVRGFRTGFAKTTQLFAKELIYQLPDLSNTRKLVVFSDSREDAAQIANGIERNHFTDLLREILINELHQNHLKRSDIIQLLDSGADVSEYSRTSADAFFEIEQLFEDSQIAAGHPNPNHRKRRAKAISRLDKLRNRIIKVEDLVHLSGSDSCAPIVDSFIKLGVNPGGPRIDLQTIPNTDDPWFDMFDFESSEWIRDNEMFRHSIEDGTYINLASLFFGNLFYSIEASGLGYLTIDETTELVRANATAVNLGFDVFNELIRSSIRIIGHRYKYTPNDFDNQRPLDINNYRSMPAQWRRYIRAAAALHGPEEIQLGDAILNTLSDSSALDNNGVIIRNLYIKIARSVDQVWISPRGGRPHLHKSAGICTQYPDTRIPETSVTTCEDFWGRNFLSYHAAVERRKAIRLHCEELTGQTDDQFERQRHFRNIILQDEGEPLARTIDILSVTTTLEVGVDIGALQAVMLANMPPQRFNYQQRVGRSGRRGQAYSSILTFCRGRSHDEYYFNNPHRITGDPPPTPFLAMQQMRITKRLLAKEVLRQAFRPLAESIREHMLRLTREERNSNIHGEFGKVECWDEYKSEVENWIGLNPDEIGAIVRSLKPDFSTMELKELEEWVLEFERPGSLMDRVNSVLANDEISAEDIAEKLAEGGVLPMFGMPTSIRNLYHEVKDSGSEMYSKSIDRSTDLAIYEFAPGAQKTKDKAIHTSIGFTSDLFIRNVRGQRSVDTSGDPFPNERWMIKCTACGFIETSPQEPAILQCESCGEPLIIPENIFRIRSPKGYRTDLSAGKDSKVNSDIVLSRPPIFAESNEESDVTSQNPYNYYATIADRDVSWRVNTNSDRFFQGRIYRTGNQFPFRPNFWFNLNGQWISEEYAQNISENGFRFSANQPTGEVETIALAANKNTEILRLRQSEVPEGINLNMFNQSRFGYAGIRSGFYSSAFMLQRVLADELDVDPTEIEIADVRKFQLQNDRSTAEIVLTDELPNGSGFVRYLYDNLERILQNCTTTQPEGTYLGSIHSDAHINRCKDACYDCLKVFRNMNYHGLLDWRLGVSILRTFLDTGYVAGADGVFDKYFELQDWLVDAQRLAESFASSFDFDIMHEFDTIPVVTTKKRDFFILVIHPLWDCHADGNGGIELPEDMWISEKVFEVAEFAGGIERIRFVDTFNLQRRPGWCYQKLFSQAR